MGFSLTEMFKHMGGVAWGVTITLLLMSVISIGIITLAYLIFVASKLADLQQAGMRGGFPIHVASAFKNFVGTNAVEVMARAAAPGFHFARERLG